MVFVYEKIRSTYEGKSESTRALFHQQAPAHIRIINARRNAKGAISAITHQNATAEMALRYCDIIITAARTVDKGVVAVEENNSWEGLNIHAVPLVRYMGKGMEGLHKMPKEFEAENKRVTIPTQVSWPANPRAIREKRQYREITPSLVVLVVNETKVAKDLVKRWIMATEIWYQVKTNKNVGPNSRWELCCGWGYIDNKYCNKPTCGYYSGYHRTSDHKFNVVGCTAKQGSLWVHTLDMCPNCKGNHIVFSPRCAKKTEDTKASRQSWGIGLAGWASINAASDLASGTNRP